MAVIIELFCMIQNYFTEYNKTERYKFFFNTLMNGAFENNITGIADDDNYFILVNKCNTHSLPPFMEGKFPHFPHVKNEQSAH